MDPLIGGLRVNPLLKELNSVNSAEKGASRFNLPLYFPVFAWNGKETAKESRHRPAGIQAIMSRTQEVEIVVSVFLCETKIGQLSASWCTSILLRQVGCDWSYGERGGRAWGRD